MKFPWKETVFTGCCVAILAGLGTWQVKRMEWKNDLVAKLTAAYDNASSSPVLDASTLDGLTTQKEPLSYGRIEGRLLRDKAVLLGPKTEDGRTGFHLLVPVALDSGHTLIVNTGWVNDLWQDNLEDRLSSLPMEPVTVRGVVHKPDWSSFASQNSPSNDMWFRADITQIAQVRKLEQPYPFILYADAIEPPLHDITLHETGWLPRNKHLQYALFWYAMGLALLGVYGFYVYGQRKKKAL